MTKEDRTILTNFCQRILGTPRMPDQQPFISKDGRIWCSDWEIIEILKYLFNERAMYLEDPLPNRLNNNPLFPGKEYIMAKADKLTEEFKTAEAIVEQLEKRRNEHL